MDTINRISCSDWVSTSNAAKKRDLLIAAGLLGLFLFALIMFIVSSSGLAAFWCIVFILGLLGSGFFVYSAFKLSQGRYSSQLKSRRDSLRKYLRIENDRYYHKRGLHWKPSPECSFLILKTNFNPETEEDEVWITSRGRNHH